MNLNARTIDRIMSSLILVAIIVAMLLNLIPAWSGAVILLLVFILEEVSVIRAALETAVKSIQEDAAEDEVESFKIIDKQTGERVATVSSDMISVGEAYEVVITKKE